MNRRSLVVWLVGVSAVVAGCAAPPQKPVQIKIPGQQYSLGYLQQAKSLEIGGDDLGALKFYKVALTIDPTDTEAQSGRNRMEQKLKQAADTQYAQGIEFYKQGNFGKAKQRFLMALRFWPDHTEALEVLTQKKRVMSQEFVWHTIQPGESLSKVAKHYYGNFNKYTLIARYNEIEDATKVRVGQKIKVPTMVDGQKYTPPPQPEMQPVETAEMTKPKTPPADPAVEASAMGSDTQPPASEAAGDTPAVVATASDSPTPEAVISVPETAAAAPTADASAEIASVTDTDLSGWDEFLAQTDSDAAAAESHGESATEKIDQVEIYREQGVMLFGESRYEDAIYEFVKVLGIQPDDPVAKKYTHRSYFEQGVVLLDRKEYLPARDKFQKSLDYQSPCQQCHAYINRCEDEFKRYHYKKGMEYYSKEDPARAIEEWQQVQALDPEYKQVNFLIQKADKILENIEQIKKSQ